MTSMKTILTTLLITLAAGPAAAAQAPAPQLAAGPMLFVDPSLGKDTVAIAFRTDAALAHKGKGTLDGGAGLKGAPHSILTFSKKARRCYLSFVGPYYRLSGHGDGRLFVGHRYAVTLELAGTTATRRVTLRKRTTEKAVARALGC
ncbi:MAG: hypothetical protein ACXVSX_06725 [Solirubrobacteraceae bacterium]